MGGWLNNLREGTGLGDADAWLALQFLPGITPERLTRIEEVFGDARTALSAPVAEFARLAGPKARGALAQVPPGEMAETIRKMAQREGASLITRADPEFPEPLRNIFAPPGAFWMEGTLEKEDAFAVAIVGARNATAYGRRQARRFAGGLAARGFTIVSGLARGIDTEAHRGALEAGGRTIAVLGCGLGEQYPAENGDLRREIARQGAVISEFPWEMRPYPQNFPRRNRLISGLALGTLVIEASLRSGALLTGRLAREQGRELMALPGSIETGSSAGSHHLIREGAHLVEKPEDVLDALPDFVQKAWGGVAAKSAGPDVPAAAPALPPEEAALIPLLEQGETSIEELSQASAQRPELVSGALLSLELKGLVRQTASGRFERAG